MNNKIYIIATPENKHLIIPYLESLGGVNIENWDVEDIEINESWFIWEGTKNIDAFDNDYPEGYTEYKFPEQPSELDLLKKENEQLRECLAKGLYAIEIWCATIEEHVDEYDTQFIKQAKQLLK